MCHQPPIELSFLPTNGPDVLRSRLAILQSPRRFITFHYIAAAGAEQLALLLHACSDPFHVRDLGTT
jgi:hypothetical protein